MSVSYVCIRFRDSYRFLSSSSDKLINAFIENNHKILENIEEFPGKEIILIEIKKLDFFISNDKYENESMEKLEQ